MKNKMYLLMVLWLALTGTKYGVSGLDNGLALTPPMGWLTWLRYGCKVNCDKYPDECISEKLIKRMADLMVSEGYLAAGYEYLGIDDCWLEKQRSPDGRMVPDRRRFPSGMKALADYIHGKGLKFAMYQDYGNATCQGYPGLIGHEDLDIATFVEWDVDYLKIDGCGSTFRQRIKGYPEFGDKLNATGRPILYSCSWPAYEEVNSYHSNYSLISKYCNIWRNYFDIADSWYHLQFTMDWFGDNQERFAQFAGPGSWNDPDFLLVGNKGLTINQARVQMAVWVVMAAPLMMSVDLGAINQDSKEILLNKNVIAVSQDRLGKQGLRVCSVTNKNGKPLQEIWRRELLNGAYAVAFVNRVNSTVNVTYNFEQMKIPAHTYEIQDLYDVNQQSGKICPDEDFPVQINATGIQFYKFIPMNIKELKQCKYKTVASVVTESDPIDESNSI